MARTLSLRSSGDVLRWSAGIAPAVFVALLLRGASVSAQTVTTEADVTVGHSTQDVDAAATQVRAYGELRGWRYYGDVTWAARRGEDSDAFGAAYPYEPELKLMEAFVERTDVLGRYLLGTRVGRYGLIAHLRTLSEVGVDHLAINLRQSGRPPAEIIEELALLRSMIATAGEIAELGYSLPDDVAKAVDQAESMIFNLAQHRVASSTASVHELLGETLDRLEQLYERGESITGTPTGYVDLDEILAGLQPNALVVVGARPAMGKTSFALGMAAHAALASHKPSLVFSLEMSRLEITQRLLSSEARVDASRMRTGKLSEADWEKLGRAVGPLAEAPIWIDDNPNVTVMEIRSKARKLKSQVGDLGIVVVDYIQLMTGRSGAESRQVEVAEISRGLKILAREIEAPVVALAQLNRGLEQRADKRAML